MTISALLLPVTATINHLLAQEPWARQQLARHAGKLACIDAGPAVLRLRIAGDGLVEAAPADAGADMTIRIKPADLPLLLQNRERAFSYVKIEGDAEFANTISQLGKQLRWDTEHDLERVVGPIAAARLVSGARSLFAAAKSGQQKLAENVAEFFLEEQPLLVRPAMVDELAGGVVRLRDDVERAAKRIEKLERKLAQKTAPKPAAASPGSAPPQQSLDHK
ncbi:MAG TPA: SCP2 sterol-binding domain-containing protein [Janthinobacterium sp.]|jgi:ubiquinone biosynthesis protein UbiJ|nr:SCP2 sterol-binding domain-containing protein [Janthinobacterium sp.]